MRTIPELSYSKILTRIQMDTATGCWLWQGSTDKDGYGRYSKYMAHRAVWEVYAGETPPPELDHLCRNRLCVRPSHLEDVTHRENVLRGESPSAHKAKQETCSKGHPLVQGARQRICRPCAVERSRAYRERKKQRSET